MARSFTKYGYLVFGNELWLDIRDAAKIVGLASETLEEAARKSLAGDDTDHFHLSHMRDSSIEVGRGNRRTTFVRFYDVESTLLSRGFLEPHPEFSKYKRARSLRLWHAAVRNGLPRLLQNQKDKIEFWDSSPTAAEIKARRHRGK